MANKIYTGVGSRETPLDTLQEMKMLARCLAIRGYTLRSGGADGADSAFEYGCDQGNGRKEIYLPWYRFNQNKSRLYIIPEDAYAIAETLHERWQYLKAPVRKLHARNVLQVLGQELNEPSQFVLCWTRGGAQVGGTATAMRLAVELEIPIVNLWHGDVIKRLATLGVVV